jgi:hypothetical protein
MKVINRLLFVVFGVILLSPVIPELAGLTPQAKTATTDLPSGEGKDVLVKECIGCHQLTVVTSQHKSESGWTDTIVEMRNRGANGSDEEMEKLIHYLTANFGPQSAPAKDEHSKPAASSVGSGSGAAMALPPKKPQPTPQRVIDEHIAALNDCDWKRIMAQYDGDIEFLSKDGAIVKGREAIGDMFKKDLLPTSSDGQCGMKLIPEHTVVVGETVNVVWRAEAPFFAEPYRGSEAFETRNGLLVLQVTTWDPSALKMKK